MKRLFLLFILSLLFVSCTRIMNTQKISARVLTIETSILEGKTIGQFLGSSSGVLRNDVIKVGVEFEFEGVLYLEDLKLKHAELAYYKDQTHIELEAWCKDSDDYRTYIEFILTSTRRTVVRYYINSSEVDRLFEKYGEWEK